MKLTKNNNDLTIAEKCADCCYKCKRYYESYTSYYERMGLTVPNINDCEYFEKL